jgi:hypothetical protein
MGGVMGGSDHNAGSGGAAETRAGTGGNAGGGADERAWAAGEVVRGLRVRAPLPAGAVPEAAILLVKCSDASGRTPWTFRATEGLSVEEIVGALSIRLEQLKRSV